ncbi:MAG TPA: polysaccharide deacetylase family protein [Syntrophorhabdaceae bacterium]|nr:putative 4-deoxy-4-formamido-L-arabinose-phosphoundecaprenol deformylase ArnD [Syntrophorhabdaceae bacterium]OQC47061.1 MAG: putative 4-deoxy-4-formamido-L-arabinose-phosphoundecaprenol deformylase ArnD [Deltaproteobacteria bacterium ADurb.Bin026]HNZ58816.1 polysaccharide deacetylase family protein [Syntrophorhabdaceae bacterium]HOF58047.1 polysaccharide deacetylase family protein [Syntrophorhabdaceae bacterium]HPH42769.1 polysaccharide deacetylase family protein [Syntrophorhabdaceae bacteri
MIQTQSLNVESGGDIFNKTIGIKVDVDTSEGMKHGVPVLLALFKKHHIKASFFVPMGKDHTGRTVKRVFTRKGFLKKAGRVGVISTYGIKTLLYGIVLPGPEIAKENRTIIKDITDEGHELGIHGYDHVYWHDHIKHISAQKTEEILHKSVNTFKELLSENPKSFAAPGWMVNAYALRFFENNGFIYTSNARGHSPFYPSFEGEEFHILELPSTLPTLDEVVGVAGTDRATLTRYFLDALKDGLNIMTVHTELEGNRWAGFLDGFLRETLKSGYTYNRLIEIAEECKALPVETCEMRFGYVDGRAGEVSLQK